MRVGESTAGARHIVRRAFATFTIVLGSTVWVAPPAQADPPPWAPAHGYRAKQEKHKHKHEHVVYVAPFGIDLGRCNRDLLGSVLGAAAGAAIGSAVGDGDEGAIIGGTIIGAIVGGGIGRAMDQIDQNCVGQVLEHAPDGETVIWTGGGGPRFQVTPVRTYEDDSGRYCREYTTSAVIDDTPETVSGVACRQPDGSWRLVS